MRLVCPSCGAIASLEAWTNDENVRFCVNVVCMLPQPLASYVPQYLSLFRDYGSKRGLSWPKVKRVLMELTALLETGEIKWKNKAPRPNSARAWALAMERVIENPPRSLPLKSHGYLRAIAYEMADEIDREKEIRRELERGRPYKRKSDSRPVMSREEVKKAMEALKKNLQKGGENENGK